MKNVWIRMALASIVCFILAGLTLDLVRTLTETEVRIERVITSDERCFYVATYRLSVAMQPCDTLFELVDINLSDLEKGEPKP